MKRHIIIAILFLCISVSFIGCGDSPTSPKRAKIVYVAMGASDAVGIGAFPLENGYVYRIRDGLKKRAQNVYLYNLGVPGIRIGFIEDTELPVAITCKPEVVTIWAGANDIVRGDSAEKFENSLEEIFSKLRQETTAFIIIANIPDLTELPSFQDNPDSDVTPEKIAAYNTAIARQAVAYNVSVVDLLSGEYASDWEYVSIDGFHPSNEGHAKLAELYLDIILDYF
jgi:lysophospholipase L1-like esterase